MTKSGNYTVIGGGIIGMLIARELVLAGKKVTLLERGPVARESSWAGGGILSPLYPWRYPKAVNALAALSQQSYPSLAADLTTATGINPEWTPSGLLITDLGAEMEMATTWARQYHISLEPCRHADITEIEPTAGPDLQAGVWLPQVAQIRNPRLTQALYQWLCQQGVEFREHAEVTYIKVSNNRVCGVQLVSEDLPVEQLIVAAGAWSGIILQQLGYTLPVRPVQGQMVLFQARPGLVKSMVLSRDRYVIPRRDGRVLVGSTLEEVDFDKHTTESARRELESEACRIIPALADYPVETHWAGLRPGSPEGIPFIGPHPAIEGLWVCAGHFRNGVVLGPSSAGLLADLLLDREPRLDPLPYRLPSSGQT